MPSRALFFTFFHFFSKFSLFFTFFMLLPLKSDPFFDPPGPSKFSLFFMFFSLFSRFFHFFSLFLLFSHVLVCSVFSACFSRNRVLEPSNFHFFSLFFTFFNFFHFFSLFSCSRPLFPTVGLGKPDPIFSPKKVRKT